jgi:Rrf2 family protein
MLSKKAQYAFHALTFLVENRDVAPCQTAEIAASKHISVKFLESILLELKRAGVLGAKKGKGGGYYLIKEPSEVPLAYVMRVIDGPIALLPCVSLNFYEPCEHCDENTCGLNHMMAEVRDSMLQILENKSLLDLASR